MSINYYDLYDKARRWPSLKNEQCQSLIEVATTCDGGPWCYTRLMAELMKNVPVLDKEKIFCAFMHNAHSRDFGKCNDVKTIMDYAIGHFDMKLIKQIIMSAKNPRAYRLLFMTPNLNIQEEVAALKGLSLVSVAPEYLYENNYVPNLTALKKLPTITRLKVLEALMANSNIGYNIFANISETEMESLLFGSFGKYQERVKNVWSLFLYFSRLEKNSRVKLTYSCKICGNYDITINSKKLHKLEDFKYTKNARCLNWNVCIFCSSSGTQVDFKNLS